MKKKLIVCLVIILTFSTAFYVEDLKASSEKVKTKEENVPEELRNLYAQSAVLMDAGNGRILFGKNENDVMPMASTTKIMTCILVLENADMKDTIEVSKYAASQPRVKLGMIEGEEYYIEDLLYSLMLESHNDSAVALAEHVAGSVGEFADLMNKKANEIGCNDTHFITPNGLDASDETGIHSTTAADLARIMRYCIEESSKKELFLNITQTRNHTFNNVSGERQFVCNNHNAFLDMMDGVISGKTGFTAEAGYCYVGALQQNDEKYIVALLACGWPNNKNYKWSDTKKLMQYGLEKYSYKNIWEKTEIDEVLVENGMPNGWDTEIKVAVKEEKNDDLCLLVRDGEKVTIEVVMDKTTQAPVKKNSKAGEIKYYISSSIIGKNNLYFSQNIDKKSWWKYLVKITKKMLIS